MKKMYNERWHAEAAGWAGLGALIGVALVVVIIVVIVGKVLL